MLGTTIKTRLSGLILLCILAILTVGATAYWGVNRLATAAQTLQKQSVPALLQLAQWRTYQLKSVLMAREGAVLNIEPYEALQNKDDAIVEVRELYSSILQRRAVFQQQAQEALALYRELPKRAGEQSSWQALEEQIQLFNELNADLISATEALASSNDWFSIRQGVQNYKDLEYPMTSFLENVEEQVEALRDVLVSQAQEVGEQANTAQQQAITAIALVTIASAVLLSLLVLMIVRSVVGPLSQLRLLMMQVAADYDFSRRIETQGNDELAQTAQAFNDLLSTTQASLIQVRDNAKAIAVAALDTSSTSKKMAQVSDLQSEAASAMAAAIEQVTVSIGDVANNAHEVRDKSQLGRDNGEQGARLIQAMAQEMDHIDASVGTAQTTIDQVNDQSGQIQSITHVIREVAEQTNLLALNAAIEAARAGEQGRGFAVVADEVRQLAERTARSTVDIRQRVESMQQSVTEAAGGMNGIVQLVRQGKDMSNTAVSHIVHVEEMSVEIADAISVITSALHEQRLAVEGIAKEVESVAQMSRDNSEVAKQTSSISHVLQNASDQLEAAVARFRL